MTIQQSRQRLKEAEEAYKTSHPGRDLTEAREELTHARAEYLADCADVVERLDYLLGPFALEAGQWHKRTKDNEFIYTVRDAGDLPNPHKDSPITVGDLRALAKLYEEVR